MTQDEMIDTLIDAQGRLYSEEIGANIARNTPQELFHWLIGAIMLSARISAHNAVEGAAALRRENLHTIDALIDADRKDVVRVLNENGYARYDESTADYLHDTAVMVRNKFDGDLRHVRGHHALEDLQSAKGLGPLGAHIFAREAQLVWEELYPELGQPAHQAAVQLNLPDKAERLHELAGTQQRYVRLVAALTRVALDGPAEEVEKLL